MKYIHAPFDVLGFFLSFRKPRLIALVTLNQQNVVAEAKEKARQSEESKQMALYSVADENPVLCITGKNTK